MGGELIHRERRHTQLTELGKLVLPMMESIIAQADAARSVSREYQRKENAPLKIGLTSCVSANLLVSPLAEVARFVPGLQEGIADRDGCSPTYARPSGSAHVWRRTSNSRAPLITKIDYRRASPRTFGCGSRCHGGRACSSHIVRAALRP
jgi:DNA-binding transcriptional LysR family regulator